MNNDYWTDLAIAACANASIDCRSIETIATWEQYACANAVYRIGGGRYLKVFGPGAEWQFHVERSVLKTVEAYHEIPAPIVIGDGEVSQNRPYLILTEVPGSTAEEIWDLLSRPEQLALATDIGKITASIHRLPQDDLAAIEKKFGGMREHTKRYRDHHIANIEATDSLSVNQQDELHHFIHVEAWEHLNGARVLAHFDMVHNHVYLARKGSRMKITGIIDWGEAMLGPAEWDISYLWFWTFSGDNEAMRHCMQTYYADAKPPKRFARRCLASLFHTSSMALLWPKFVKKTPKANSIVRELTEYLFPSDLFGHPD